MIRKCDDAVIPQVVIISDVTRHLPILRSKYFYKNQACIDCHIQPDGGSKNKNIIPNMKLQCSNGLYVDFTDDIPIAFVNKYCKLTVSDKGSLWRWLQERRCYPDKACNERDHPELNQFCKTFLSLVQPEEPDLEGVFREKMTVFDCEFEGKSVLRGFRNVFCAMCVALNFNVSKCVQCEGLYDDNDHNGAFGVSLPSYLTISAHALHEMFVTDWEYSASDVNRKYNLRMRVQVTSRVMSVQTLLEYMELMMYTRIATTFKNDLQHMSNTKLDCNAVNCTEYDFQPKEKQWHASAENGFDILRLPRHNRVVLAFNAILLVKKYKSVIQFSAKLLQMLSLFGILPDENMYYEQINTTFSAEHPLREFDSTCQGKIIHFQDDDYELVVGEDGYDFIRIKSTHRRLRIDSDAVRLYYSSNHTSRNTAVNLRTSLIVCSTDIDNPWVRTTSGIACIASICGLGFIGLTFFKFESIRSSPGRNFLHMTSSMAVSLAIWFLFSQNANKILCTFTAIASHYTWLVMFFWMSVNGFDTWHTFHAMTVDHSAQTSWYRMYCTYAYGTPAVIVSTSVFVTYLVPKFKFAYGADRVCWLRNPIQQLVTFILPVGLISVSNLLLFIAILAHICKARKVSSMATSGRKSMNDYLPYVKLPVLLGLSWLLGFLGSQWKNQLLWIIFDITNASQGVLLFLIFISSKRNRGLYGLIRRKRVGKNDKTNVSKISSAIK